jgi:hypothetical protein
MKNKKITSTHKKNNPRRKKSEESKGLFLENPFMLAIMVFTVAFLINYLLELEFTKNLFEWTGYYFNLALYSFNSFIQTIFKNHPYIKISLLTNPITPEIMAIINPWMWLRGYIISSFAIGQSVTLLQIKKINSNNIITAIILIGMSQLYLYAMSNSPMFSTAFFIPLVQKFYINILVLMAVCHIGISIGIEYSIYLFQNEKIKVFYKDKEDHSLNIAEKMIKNKYYDVMTED